MTRDWSHPDLALDALTSAFPDLTDAVERAQVRASDAIADLDLHGEHLEQAVADIMRSALAAELEKVSEIPGQVETGVRNSIVLRPYGQANIRIRVLREPKRGGVPTASSSLRAAEFKQGAFDFEDVVPEAVTLTLTWRLTSRGVRLSLAMPTDPGTSRRGPTLAWKVSVPVEPSLDLGPAPEPDINYDDDTDLDIKRKRDDEAEDGDDPA